MGVDGKEEDGWRQEAEEGEGEDCYHSQSCVPTISETEHLSIKKPSLHVGDRRKQFHQLFYLLTCSCMYIYMYNIMLTQCGM